MSSVLASLRPQGSQISPTSSASSHTTTPTSPHFHHAPHRVLNHPYASSSHSLEPRYQGSSLSLATISSAISHPRAPTPPLYHAPPNQSFSSYLRSWGPDEIATFLGVYKCGHYVGMFQRNDIDGKVLLDLDMAALKEIGVTKVGERVKLLGGIKDLRKRAAAAVPAMERSRVELRLNGGATPPLGESASPSLSPAVEMRSRLITPSERMHGTGMATGAARRLNTARPPPLDLQPHVSSRPLPLAYQGTVARPGTEARAITPRPIPPRPALQSKASSDTTMAPLHTLSRSNSGLLPATSVPAPAPRPNNLNLRAPPPREAGRRSPSPITNDAADFVNRPLPPAPGQQSSAAEYASSITQQRQHTPTYGDPKYGVTRAPSHRQAPSLSVAPSKPISPIRAKFSAARPAVAPHPFAAPRTREDEKKTSPPHPDTSSLGSDKRNQAGGYVFGSGGMITSKSSSSGERPRKAPSDNMPQVPLEDIRRQVVRFLNKEDGTTRTVNVASCVSGVEVLERVLKKFGKWGIGMSTDTESDEDGDRLEVAGWGVYAESDPDPEAKPLSEASLLGICMSHRDGGAIREEGLILSRHKKREYRKNIQEFFGETPPPPMSPDSPTYYGPRLGVHSPERNVHGRDTLSGLGKKMNRASTVSIMSGLGVPMGDVPPSPTLRFPSSGSFLATKGRKMYNFFGHRPPSELVFTHLPEYFPSAKKSELEKTFRQSMLRPAARRGSVAPSESKMSFEVPGERRGSASTESKVSPPRRTRPVSTRTISSPPPAETIPEEAEAVGEAVPRLSVYNDGGESIRASIDGASDASSIASGEIRPPLLPPFEPSKESLSDSLHAYSRNSGSARKRPKSALLGRRGSGGSTKSRVSMLSQLRRNRDRSDNASLLTVDEITAEVENRRASTITFDDSGEEEEEEEEEIFASAAAEPGPIPHDESEESGEEASEDEEEVEDDEEEESEDGDEHGRAFTSTGSARIIKWIKGALIGAGSFGSVHLGMDAHSGLLMAVKQVELPTGSARNEERKRNMVSALEREIELLKELQHENIVQYLDSSADGNHLNIFLEYVPGGSVAALLSNYGAFEEALVRNFVRQILTGLNYLHEREIIHRDIKGANILVDNKGGIKISDFGISKKVESNLMGGMRANRPSLQGSVFWMAPEIVKQTSYTIKADIWSVGCLVVEMLTGTHPWADLDQMQAMFKIGSFARPVLPSDISPEAAALLRRTFEINHDARPTAAQLLEHPFIASKHAGGISAVRAKATMNAANAQRGAIMEGMQSLSALVAG